MAGILLEGVRQTSDGAASASRRVLSVIDKDRQRIEQSGRPSASVLRAFQCAQRRPVLSANQAASAMSVSFPTASSALDRLERLGILREITGRQRSRLYVYSGYLDILSEGTEPL